MGVGRPHLRAVGRVEIVSHRHPPFYDLKPLGIYQKILKGIIEFPAFMTVRSKDLIRKLLNPEVRFRLGSLDVRKG